MLLFQCAFKGTAFVIGSYVVRVCWWCQWLYTATLFSPLSLEACITAAVAVGLVVIVLQRAFTLCVQIFFLSAFISYFGIYHVSQMKQRRQNIDVKTWRSPACDPISTDPILMHCGVCFFLFRAKNFSSINHPLDISSLVYVLLSPHPFRIVIVWLAKSSGRKLVTALTAVFLQTHNSFRTQM